MVTGGWEMVNMDKSEDEERSYTDLRHASQERSSIEEGTEDGAVTRRDKQCCWRTFAISALTLSAFLLVGLVVIVTKPHPHTHSHPDTPEMCPASCNVSRSEYIDAPMTPFSELTSAEVKRVVDYFNSTHGAFKLTPVTEAGMGDNFIHVMEAQLPPKAEVLAYLEGRGPMPERAARVIVFRGNATPPVVEEYFLPLTSSKEKPMRARLVQTEARKTRVPYSMRPFSRVEFRYVFQRLTRLLVQKLGPVLEESYGAKLGPGCGPRCLRLSMTPISSAFLPPDTRSAWFWLAYNLEFYTLHPLDMQILVDTTSTNPSLWAVRKVYYADQYFSSLEELAERYKEGSINKTRVPFPDRPEEELYSSLHLRGDPFPQDGKPPPVSVLPQGNRFTVKGSRVDYMRWAFTLRVSPTVGLQLFDVGFGGERIAYEVSVQEIAVLYSGYTPQASMLYFADSAGLFGSRMRGMMEGEDCPPHAVYLDTEMFTSNDGGLKRFTRALCLFEHNPEVPLRRHRAYSISGAFYGGLSDTVLVVRAFVSLINYDYILDYRFHNNGALEVSVSSTGYLSTSFYLPPEERYGTRINTHVTAGMHQHLFHVKADMDVAGTRNDFSTLDVGVETKKDTWAHDPTMTHTQYMFTKNPRRTESEACYKYNFPTPKYLLLSGGETSPLGNRRSYRVIVRGMSPPVLPENDAFENSVPWARCQVAVTRHKDQEMTSSSMFAMWDARDPVVNFTSYMADDESIEQQDLVTWVTLGTFHIPSLENTPNTATVGTTVSMFLAPFNFFASDPSMASRDAVRVSPLDQSRPLDGAVVERYNSTPSLRCLPDVTLPDDDLLEHGGDLFS